MPNLAGILAETAARLPDQTALRINDTVISYSALNAMSAQVAGLLRARASTRSRSGEAGREAGGKAR